MSIVIPDETVGRMRVVCAAALFVLVQWTGLGTESRAADLVGHWPLTGDVQDQSGRGQHGVNRGVMFPRIAGGGRRAARAFKFR